MVSEVQNADGCFDLIGPSQRSVVLSGLAYKAPKGALDELRDVFKRVGFVYAYGKLIIAHSYHYGNTVINDTS